MRSCIFRSNGLGSDSETATDEMDNGQLHRRFRKQWRLPAGLDNRALDGIRDKVLKDYVGKTWSVYPGQEFVLFMVTPPKGQHTDVTICVRKHSPLAPLTSLATPKKPETLESPSATALQDEAIRLARKRHEQMKMRSEAGVANPLEVSATQRDLEMAEARGKSRAHCRSENAIRYGAPAGAPDSAEGGDRGRPRKCWRRNAN
jgi:hypothetical protein